MLSSLNLDQCYFRLALMNSGSCAVIELATWYLATNNQTTPPHTLILGNQKQTSQKKKLWNTYFLNNVRSHAKSQPLLSTNEKTPKMSVN